MENNERTLELKVDVDATEAEEKIDDLKQTLEALPPDILIRNCDNCKFEIYVSKFE